MVPLLLSSLSLFRHSLLVCPFHDLLSHAIRRSQIKAPNGALIPALPGAGTKGSIGPASLAFSLSLAVDHCLSLARCHSVVRHRVLTRLRVCAISQMIVMCAHELVFVRHSRCRMIRISLSCSTTGAVVALFDYPTAQVRIVLLAVAWVAFDVNRAIVFNTRRMAS
jgi:hypothetical protein